MTLSELLMTYVAADRRQALASGAGLPARASGTALWADLSGFTSLSELMARDLGDRHGAEQMALQLNEVYTALIAPLDSQGGSLVGFSGDAITCWFEQDDGRRAITVALAMQAAMRPFASLELSRGSTFSLSIKTVVCSGAVRRLQVGDPRVQSLDIMAGATLDRLAAIGHLARAGEVLVDEATEKNLGDLLKIGAYRVSKQTQHRAGVVSSLGVEAVAQATSIAIPTDEQLRPWLLPAVYARLVSGQGEFLTELRPAVALFMRFDGLDYENDEQIGERLDGITRQVQAILHDYDGTLLQLTIDDKGSYLYAAFGAPVAHEDDVVRAVEAALELCRLPLDRVSIGLSQGLMRTGSYGGPTRRTYGVLGDEVNLAARLMELAQPGQVLASAAVWQAAHSEFEWKSQRSLRVKGRQTAVRPAILVGRRPQAEARHRLALAMIGRQAELAIVEEKLGLALQGHGQVVSITGEAGMGKSRLVAQVLRDLDGVPCYAGECQSYGMQSSYLVWHAIWRSFFGLEAVGSKADQIERLEQALEDIDPALPERLPLLGPAVNLSIPDNALTSGLDAKARRSSREALLLDCVRARAGQGPLVLVLEDVHWIDPLSRDMLDLLGRAIRHLPVLVLLAYRPPAATPAAEFLPGLANLDYGTEVRLVELNREETRQLISARLAHFGLGRSVPAELVEPLLARTQGNPFYIEELLSYLYHRGLDPREPNAWAQADLPDSLQSLILSRIDQLAEGQQITLKAASIIGRLFQVAWLYGYYPALGGEQAVSANLEILERLDLVVLETAVPNLAYLFKHVITQEVAYQSLAFATRAALHEQFARYLEQLAGQDLRPYLDLLAYHYERSDNLAKKREYLRLAGETSQAVFANEAALSYLERALALAPETDYEERYNLLSTRVAVDMVLGRPKEQSPDLETLSALAEILDDDQRRAQVAVSRALQLQAMSDFPQALDAAQQAVAFAHQSGSAEEEARGYWRWGEILNLQGKYAEAYAQCERGLAISQEAGLNSVTAGILMTVGNLNIRASQYDAAQAALERALEIQEQVGNWSGRPIVYFLLGEIDYYRGELSKAQAFHEQALPLFRLIGYKQNEARTLSRIGDLITEQRGDFAKARNYSEQALALLQDVGDREGMTAVIRALGAIDLFQNNYLSAQRRTQEALDICQEIGLKYFAGACIDQLGGIANELGDYASAMDYHNQGLALMREIEALDGQANSLMSLGDSFYRSGQYELSIDHTRRALSIWKEFGIGMGELRAQTLLGHALRESGDLDQASESYRQAQELGRALKVPAYCVKPAQAGLACIALERQDLTQAQAHLDDLPQYIEASLATTADEIIFIYLVCYRVFQAAGDPRARAVLQAAYGLVQQIAEQIDDENLRASFLQNVPANRQVVEAWQSLGGS